MRYVLLCAMLFTLVGCDGLDLTQKPGGDPIKKPVVDTKPDHKPPASFNAAAAIDELVKQAEESNDSIAEEASEYVGGVIDIAVKRGDMPKEFADKIKAAVPAIGAMPARDLTVDEVSKIRALK